MKTASERKAEFLKDLEELLEKHNATIEGIPDTRILVTIKHINKLPPDIQFTFEND